MVFPFIKFIFGRGCSRQTDDENLKVKHLYSNEVGYLFTYSLFIFKFPFFVIRFSNDYFYEIFSVVKRGVAFISNREKKKDFQFSTFEFD